MKKIQTMKNTVFLISASVALAITSMSALAQSGPVQPAYKIPDGSQDKDSDGPRGITLTEGVGLYPYLNFSYGRNNNLFLANTNRRSSDVATYNPGLRLVAEGRSMKFGLSHDITMGRFAQSSADNYTNYNTAATGEFVISSSAGLKLGMDYTKSHDPRGSTDRGVSGEPDEYRSSGPSFLFAYGANDAKGRIEVEAGTTDRRYLNNRASTVGSDRDTDNFAGRFFFRVAPKTSLILEAREGRLDYKLSTSQQDSKERRYLVGVTWDATAATSGTVKVGRIRKDFAVSTRRDSSSTGWEANITWKPLSYSKVDFFTTKSVSESTGLGDFTLAKRYGTSWTHGWNSRLTSTASLSRTDEDFIGSTRADKTDSLGLKLDYKVMRWLTVGGEVTNTSRDSNSSNFNYKKNLYLLTIGATL
jgi:polysaccharide biosynthesis protein VpsM